jgi:pilus assembly protein CpaE
MRALVASNESEMGTHVGQILQRHGFACPAAHLVTLDLAADRASRLCPDVVVVVVGSDPQVVLFALRELRHTVDAHLLVVGPADDPKLIMRMIHEGADEYLDASIVEQEISEAMIRFKARQTAAQDRRQQGCHVISVLAPSGGSGSSTLAANIGAVLAQRHGTCGLFDLRLSAGGDLASLLDLRPTFSIANLCQNLDRVDRQMFQQCLIAHATGLQLLAAPPDHATAGLVTAKAIRQLFAMARQLFAYVVADLEHTLRDEQLEVLWQSDVVAVVMRLDYVSLRNTRRVLDGLTLAGLDLQKVRLVANRYGTRHQLTARHVESALGMKLHCLVPDDASRMTRALNAGTPVVIQRPRAKVSRRIRELTFSLNGCSEARTPNQATRS